MPKPLSGKRWFYSLGVRSLNPDYIGPWPKPTWAEWARLAFWHGNEDAKWARRRHNEAMAASKLIDSIAGA